NKELFKLNDLKIEFPPIFNFIENFIDNDDFLKRNKNEILNDYDLVLFKDKNIDIHYLNEANDSLNYLDLIKDIRFQNYSTCNILDEKGRVIEANDIHKSLFEIKVIREVEK